MILLTDGLLLESHGSDLQIGEVFRINYPLVNIKGKKKTISIPSSSDRHGIHYGVILAKSDNLSDNTHIEGKECLKLTHRSSDLLRKVPFIHKYSYKSLNSQEFTRMTRNVKASEPSEFANKMETCSIHPSADLSVLDYARVGILKGKVLNKLKRYYNRMKSSRSRLIIDKTGNVFLYDNKLLTDRNGNCGISMQTLQESMIIISSGYLAIIF